MNEKVKELLREYADGTLDYTNLFHWLDGLLSNGEIDKEWYDILIAIL